ncbi:MAG: nucleotidyltransferase family protein [Candidatus Eisenbacteria bacterium]|nr:nucleotidyltransferase family protein [Candidatus Eisenbacteria bacterium]
MIPLEQCFVPDRASLRDVLVALDRGSAQVALVCDERGVLVGLVTDGDVRRLLLEGATLQAPIAGRMRRDFISVSATAPRIVALELMQAHRISAIPVVDDSGRPRALHLLHDVIGKAERPNWAVVMAGGRGSRLAPLTDSVPKPMLRVAGRPILERIVLHIVEAGVRDIFLSVHYLAEVIEQHFGDGSRFGCRISYLREDDPLGTAGALSLLPARPDSSVMVMNGDLVTQADLGQMLDEHSKVGADITIGVRRYLHTVPFGCLELEGARVRSIVEKPTLSQIVNGGIYALSPSVLAEVPRHSPSTFPDLISKVLERNGHVHAFEVEDDWIDVGQRDQLRQARGEAKES